MRLGASSDASRVAYMPLFRTGCSSVHRVFRSVAVSVRQKSPPISPPQCATVSVWMSPGGTLHPMTSSPDLHSIALSSSSLRPDLRLRCIDPGFSRFTPLGGRSIVDALIESRCAAMSSGICARDAGAELTQPLVDVRLEVCRTGTSHLAPYAHEHGLVLFGVSRAPSLAHLELPASCQKPIGMLARAPRHFACII